MAPSAITADNVYTNVKEAYGYRSENAINEALSKKISVSLGYKPEDIAYAPQDANIGEGCGNPLLIANLKEGDFVVDLGSGGGFDCFLASEQVGPTGKVIGFDMTENMIDLAQKNAKKLGATNVTFIKTNINQLPLGDNTVDCVMSNCVLNLVPEQDKLSVIKEIHRILKPCGRLAVSDFLALKELTKEIKDDPALHSGCVSGSVELNQMKDFLFDIGFDGMSSLQILENVTDHLHAEDVLLVDTKKDLGLYKDGETAKSVTPCCASGLGCGPAITVSGRKELDYDLNEWISSFQIYGHKWCGKTAQNKPQVISAKDPGMIEAPAANGACVAGGCC
ncbi:putative arsenic methyltransferase Cyt19 [Hyaloscypha finlandica]|nr:putative arsenic methyltransferase Cyt19 [Hyaloscypha finlandica]